jgi:excisionase family DNA binding protein
MSDTSNRPIPAPTPENPYPEVDALPPVMTAPEVARFLGVSPRYIYQLVDEGVIDRLPLGERRVLIPREAVRKLFAQR